MESSQALALLADHRSCLVFRGEVWRFGLLLLWVGWTVLEVAVVGDNQRVMIGVDLQGEGFGRSVERDLLWDLPLLGLCVLCVVLGLPRPFAEEWVQGLSFLLQRYTLLKTMFLGFLEWKWWATKVAPRE